MPNTSKLIESFWLAILLTIICIAVLAFAAFFLWAVLVGPTWAGVIAWIMFVFTLIWAWIYQSLTD